MLVFVYMCPMLQGHSPSGPGSLPPHVALVARLGRAWSVLCKRSAGRMGWPAVADRWIGGHADFFKIKSKSRSKLKKINLVFKKCFYFSSYTYPVISLPIIYLKCGHVLINTLSLINNSQLVRHEDVTKVKGVSKKNAHKESFHSQVWAVQKRQGLLRR